MNRALDEWYVIADPVVPSGRAKGGIVVLLFSHPNPVASAVRARRGEDGLVWGRPLKRRIENWLPEPRRLSFEVFTDWLPVDSCCITLDPTVKDHWAIR